MGGPVCLTEGPLIAGFPHIEEGDAEIGQGLRCGCEEWFGIAVVDAAAIPVW